ncbi:hypothetical protein VN97_g4367 [Penicillium thymicola]|uniref:Uncharacterized protein n=1 Tax=Penicillium thymicola TaxID=293382 RepID=A0AAI9TLI0_PENTH|nr:hypothetical protein VN97_g4367 [Penicillium thymicola]
MTQGIYHYSIDEWQSYANFEAEAFGYLNPHIRMDATVDLLVSVTQLLQLNNLSSSHYTMHFDVHHVDLS